MKFYAGIGSRKTPPSILRIMEHWADTLARDGWVLRSGGAPGADSAFERGALAGTTQIFLPWPGFEGRDGISRYPTATWEKAASIAADHHPAWDRCSQGARKLLTSNVFQILGPDLETPSSFVLCWTPHGSGSGGTGLGIRVAKAHDIPVFDLGCGPQVLEQLKSQLL